MAKQEEKTPKGREGRYTYNGLQPALKLATVVKNHGGDRVGVPKSVVAAGLETSGGGSAFAQLVASAKTFGIVEGMRDLSLTEQGREFFYPTWSGATRSAELYFLARPPAYKHLIDKFDGAKLPGTETLANILRRECDVSPSWCTRAAQIFINAAQNVGVLDTTGFLRYAAAVHLVGRAELDPAAPDVVTPAAPGISKTAVPQTAASPQREAISPAIAGANVWVYSEGGGTVKLETPDPLPKALWERLTKYVEVLKPGGK